MIKLCLIPFLLCLMIQNAFGDTRIISLAPNITEVLQTIGLKDKIVAVSDYCKKPSPNIPTVGSLWQPNIDRIIALKPSNVLVTNQGNKKTFAEQLSRFNVEVIPFIINNLDDIPAQIKYLGKVFNRDFLAVETAQHFDENLKGAFKPFQKRPSGLSAIWVFDTQPLIVDGQGSIYREILHRMGFASLTLLSTAHYPKIDPTLLLTQAPHVMVVGSHIDPKKLDNLTWFKQLKSVQPNMIVIQSHKEWLEQPNHYMYKGVNYLAKQLEAALH